MSPPLEFLMINIALWLAIATLAILLVGCAVPLR